MPSPRLRAAAAIGAAACLAAALSSCSHAPAAPVPGTSWAPAAVRHDGLRSVAEAGPDGFVLHTASGPKSFVPGVNLGSTTPTHQPGELAITAADYRRWFAEMGRLGVRAVRIYTIHPPAFYDELAAYNRAHPRAPLYLLQGVYLPDESYVEPGRTLYDASVDDGFTEEIADASAAVHGDLTLPPRPGHASGHWHTDVSRWLMGWVIGVEWDPQGVQRTDEQDVAAPYSPGKYFAATWDATPTERWLAEHMDELAAAEARRGDSTPIAFVNWPTTDPLRHPSAPQALEDLVGVDAEHVLPTAAWPGGTIASFHAYPYYPDFLRHEKALSRTTWRGRPDPYAGYLRALKAHFPDMPVMVTELGVPSSLGSAHGGPDGRDQGDHTEAEAMAIDADLMRLVKAQGMAGGFVFAWTDEWFKATWNTQSHQLPPDRRQLWHDSLTNEQWFGMVATDPKLLPGSRRGIEPAGGPFRRVVTSVDASYLHLDLTTRVGLPRRLTVSADVLPGATQADYRIVVQPAAGTAQAWVRAGLDPIRLDTALGHYQPDEGRPWHRYRLLTNRVIERHGHTYPAEFDDVGALVRGDWDPRSAHYDSLATWQARGDTVRLRIPWPMLGMADPSSRTALGEGIPAAAVHVDGIGLTLDADGASTSLQYTWPQWNSIGWSERLKHGASALAAAFRDVAR